MNDFDYDVKEKKRIAVVQELVSVALRVSVALSRAII